MATQYCDGLRYVTVQVKPPQLNKPVRSRGPLIIKDRQDPHQRLYDIDDGEFCARTTSGIEDSYYPSDSTIITLGDWYHLPSPEVIVNSSLE